MTTKLAMDGNAKAIQCLRPTDTTTYAVSGTAITSSAITGDVRVIRIMCDTDCFYKLNGTATVGDCPLPASTIEFIHVFDRDTISVITSSASGTFYITEMI